MQPLICYFLEDKIKELTTLLSPSCCSSCSCCPCNNSLLGPAPFWKLTKSKPYSDVTVTAPPIYGSSVRKSRKTRKRRKLDPQNRKIQPISKIAAPFIKKCRPLFRNAFISLFQANDHETSCDFGLPSNSDSGVGSSSETSSLYSNEVTVSEPLSFVSNLCSKDISSNVGDSNLAPTLHVNPGDYLNPNLVPSFSASNLPCSSNLVNLVDSSQTCPSSSYANEPNTLIEPYACTDRTNNDPTYDPYDNEIAIEYDLTTNPEPSYEYEPSAECMSQFDPFVVSQYNRLQEYFAHPENFSEPPLIVYDEPIF